MRDASGLALGSMGGPGAHLQSGARLGRYELLVPIGSGGMAVAWIARLRGDAGFSKLVAIKTMLPHLVQVVEAKRMLLDEARVAARIHHPNVVAIQELGEDQGVPYVVMEWVNGLSFDRLLGATHPLDAGVAARIIADACAGLHAAHELLDDAGRPLHVVHRDISPYNILVSLDGAVKVADFGIVKARGQLHRTASGGGIRGRISYMSPEQVLAEPVDRRADLFAMGATLHEALTGQPAFSGDNDAQIIFKIAEASYEPPPAAESHVRSLFAIAACALARSREARFSTAEDMRLALEAWLVENAPPVVTSSSIAGVVRERVGAELEQRQMQLRRALNAPRGPSTRPALTTHQSAIDAHDRVAETEAAESPLPDLHKVPTDGPASAPVSTSVAVPTPAAPAKRRGVRWAFASAALVIAVGLWAARHGVRPAHAPEPSQFAAIAQSASPPAAHAPEPSQFAAIAQSASPPAHEAPSVDAPTVARQASDAPDAAIHSREPTPPPRTGRAPTAPPSPAPATRSGRRHSTSNVEDEIPANPY